MVRRARYKGAIIADACVYALCISECNTHARVSFAYGVLGTKEQSLIHLCMSCALASAMTHPGDDEQLVMTRHRLGFDPATSVPCSHRVCSCPTNTHLFVRCVLLLLKLDSCETYDFVLAYSRI